MILGPSGNSVPNSNRFIQSLAPAAWYDTRNYAGDNSRRDGWVKPELVVGRVILVFNSK